MNLPNGHWLAVASLWAFAAPTWAQTPSTASPSGAEHRQPAMVEQADGEKDKDDLFAPMSPDEEEDEENEPEAAPPGQVPASRPAAGLMPPATAQRAVNPPERKKGLFGLTAAPLTEPIETDQGEFLISPSTVPTGHLQIESNYSYLRDHSGGTGTRLQDHVGPDLLLRAGMTDKMELRLGWGGYEFSKQREAGQSGLGQDARWAQGGDDMSVGAKFKLLEERGLLPDLGVLTMLNVPSGADPRISSSHVEPEVVLAWGKDITKRISLEGNVGLAVLSPDTGQFLQTSASIGLETKLTDRLFSYVEYFGTYPNELHHDCAHNVDVGVRYLLTRNLEIYGLVGTGLNHEAPAIFVSTGLAMRF